MSTVSPEVDKSPMYQKAAAESGSTATMTCKADGAPDVEFLWSKVASRYSVLTIAVKNSPERTNTHTQFLQQPAADLPRLLASSH